jgi:G3E family GTPase
MSAANTRLVLVGGFLGAGKTTLLQQAAARLTERGQRVALLANDQAANLVDTAVLRQSGAAVDEVAGGCFCCRFNDMVAAIDRLKRRAQPDYIIAEPVGSCTDISATVLQPLKQLHGQQISLSLYSVLIDVKQVRVLLRLHQQAQGPSAGFPNDVLYIYRKQVEEADLIVLNKADLATPAELDDLRLALASQFPRTPIATISALTGDGVGQWLDLLEQTGTVGSKITEVDYDTYAAGEAALGWLNASAKLHAREDLDWKTFVGELLEAMRAKLRAESAEIAHLKVHLTSGSDRLVGNLTSNEGPLSVRGSIDAMRRDVAMLVNARVHVQPDILHAVIEKALEQASGSRLEATIENLRSFPPGRPQPTHHYEAVV